MCKTSTRILPFPFLPTDYATGPAISASYSVNMELSQAYRNVSESVSSPSPVPTGAETHGKTRITANP